MLLLAAGLTALITISLLEPLRTFEVAAASQSSVVQDLGDKWNQAMMHLPAKAYFWMLLVYFAGGLAGGLPLLFKHITFREIHYLAVALAALTLVHLSYTPNPWWFWLSAPVATAAPLYLPKYLFRKQQN
ncbi:MAG: hypothetical protein IPM52_05865 [Bacteroidetes bacterium]|nr:hypothetical protein [Bacteroidota bacterium]